MTSQEDQRVLELYRYYAPDDEHDDSTPPTGALPDEPYIIAPSVSPTEITSPNTTLTALCQLTAIRLQVQRVGISLIGHRRQYILAEATRTLDLQQPTRSADPADGLVFGLVECSRVGNLCENTVALPPKARDDVVPPCFTILDLSQDPRFAQAPYVLDGPLMRFYCGTPITSRHGLNIGSFWLLDNRLLPALTDDQKVFLGTMASLVMKQLELSKERSDRDRAMRMRAALSCFVSGTQPAVDERRVRKNGTPVSANASLPGAPSSAERTVPVNAERLESLQHEMAMSVSNADLDSIESSDGEPAAAMVTTPAHTPHRDRARTFARAAYLMREAFGVEGCLILDTAVGFLPGGSDAEPRTNDHHHPPVRARLHEGHGDEPPRRARPGMVLGKVSDDRMPRDARQKADVLAFATKRLSSLRGDNPAAVQECRPVAEALLVQLTRRYPEGTTWSFGPAGLIAPAREHGGRAGGPAGQAEGDEYTRRSEAQQLQKSFPRVRQLLFAPLFDTHLGRCTSGSFLFTSSASRVFSRDIELSYMKIFNNNVAAELSRIEADTIDRSKTDFIGSISHELRSPLHGILAAAEFLEDTHLDSFQQSLVSTQASCGKTLLQVIEHVLEFSKLEKDERSARRQARHSPSLRDVDAKTQTTFAPTDIAELFEEVVEGSVAGKSHKLDADGPLLPLHDVHGGGHARVGTQATQGRVEVILEVDYRPDWVFTTSPGALRRLLLNVLGNSLKYTAAGYILVRLQSHDDMVVDDTTVSVVSLIVNDTGKGISREFLRSRLFSPFSQEDHLSAGCGLGLSMVKSVVDNLHGQIEVRSEQGAGTTFSITLPLAHVSQPSLPAPAPVAATELSEPFRDLDLPHNQTVIFVGFDAPPDTDSLVAPHGRTIKELLRHSVAKCMHDWLGMQTTTNLDESDYVVVLVDNRLPDFIRPYVENIERKQPRVIAILQHEMRRKDAEAALGQSMHAFEVIGAPVGPRKMARAVHACETAARRWAESTRNARLPNDHAMKVSPKTSTTAHDPDAACLNGNGVLRQPDAHVEGDAPPLTEQLKSREEHPRTAEKSNGALSRPPIPTDTVPIHPTPTNRTPDPPEKRTPHLLLVDDNVINLRLLETFILKRATSDPYTYSTATNGLLALTSAQTAVPPYDIIFMDLSMPVMGGMEATQKIREWEKQRGGKERGLIVALTGLANARDQEQAFAAGVDLFMTKPVRFKDIGAVLDRWVEGTLRSKRD